MSDDGDDDEQFRPRVSSEWIPYGFLLLLPPSYQHGSPRFRYTQHAVTEYMTQVPGGDLFFHSAQPRRMKGGGGREGGGGNTFLWLQTENKLTLTLTKQSMTLNKMLDIK